MTAGLQVADCSSRNNVIPEEPIASGSNYYHPQLDDESIPRSPPQAIRPTTSSFSNQIRLLKQQSEGIHEECEDILSSSSGASSNRGDSDEPRISLTGAVKTTPKSKEAEDVKPPEKTENSRERQRTSSMSDDNIPIKSILKNSPLISKEDITSDFKTLSPKSHHLSFRPSKKSRFQSKVATTTPQDRTEQGNKDAIDQYYEKNHYTITGAYVKNQRLNQLGNGNNEDDNEEDSKTCNCKTPRRSLSMAQSVRSMPIIPVNNRFHQSFYWFAHNHKRIGFRHFCMIFLVLLYTLLGAALFYTIESRYELETMKIHKLKLDREIFGIAQTLELEILDPEKLTNIAQMEEFLKNAYKKLLTAEELYSGSTYYKHESPNNLKWTYGSACFFSMNVYTTTGYGSIAPSSGLGKAFVILYGLIFVPLTAVVIRDLGQWALLYLTKMYTTLTDSFRRARGFVDKLDEDEIMSLPIKFSMGVMIFYLLSATLFIFEYDALSGPPDSGISFFHAFYFSFISMSTIGLGDIMPNNVTFSPLITIMFFFGMPILKVVNRVSYICLENGVFGTMTVLENRLDQAWSKATVIPMGQAVEDHMNNKKSIVSEGMIPDEFDGSVPNEYLNNFTIRSIATFMRANGDVYGGGFGRVNMRRGDLRNIDNQMTIQSRHGLQNA